MLCKRREEAGSSRPEGEVEAWLQGAVVTAEPFDVAGARLGHNAHGADDGESREQGDEQCARCGARMGMWTGHGRD